MAIKSSVLITCIQVLRFCTAAMLHGRNNAKHGKNEESIVPAMQNLYMVYILVPVGLFSDAGVIW